MLNKRIKISIVLAILTALFLPHINAIEASLTGRRTRNTAIPVIGNNYKPGEVLVKYKKSATLNQKEKTKSSAKVNKTLARLKTDNGDTVEVLQLKQNTSVHQAIQELDKHSAVEYAEPNYLLNQFYTPNDTNFANQWGFHNTGQTIGGTAGTPDADIDAVEAWDLERGLSNEVAVAVIDSGIDTTHPDLSPVLWQNNAEIAGNGLDDDGNGYIDDINGYNWAGISQYYFNSGWYLGSSSNNKGFAQSVKGTGQKLTQVGLLLGKDGNPTQNITVSIRSSLSGADLSSYTITPAQVSSGGGEVYKALSNPLTLTEGSTYYLRIWTENNNAANYYWILDNSTEASNYLPDPYKDGTEYWHNGLDWVEASSDDLYFRTNPNSFPRDDNGHGTHVSGIVAAATGNNTGVAGTSHGAKIMALKAGDSSGSLYTSDIISAINYAADKGAKIINMSFGSQSPSSSMQTAINNAYNAGVSLFAAAGNDYDTTVNYPAGSNNVIGVGATTNQDLRANFSNYNSMVDISAPGRSIYSTMPAYPVGLNSYPSITKNYSYLSGTSMATPMAAGLGALILSKEPSLAPARVEQTLKETADDLGTAGRDDEFGYGRINAYQALNSFEENNRTPLVSISSSTHSSSSNYYADPNPVFALSAEGEEVAGYSYMLDQSPNNVPDPVVNTTSSSISLSNVASGTWYLHVRALDVLDNWGATSTYQLKIDVEKPAINFAALDTSKYYRGTIKLSASGSDGYSGLNKIQFYLGSTLLSSTSSTPASYNFNSTSVNGTKTLTAKATDNVNNQKSSSQTIKIDNYKPRTRAPYKRKVKRYRYTRLYYKVADPYTGNKAWVTIKIRKGSKVYKIFRLGLIKINRLRYIRYRAKLAKGKYRFYIYAKDRAGNKQYNVAKNYLIIK